MKPGALLRRAVLLLALFAACAGPGNAFNRAGHFHTIRAIIEIEATKNSATGQRLAKLSPAERRLIAYCAQVPDMSYELDAAETYLHAVKAAPLSWVAWGTLSRIPSAPEFHRMIAVQQMLHSLTGGDGSAMRDVALATAADLLRGLPDSKDENRVADLCAIGFALHMYGDTYAHRQLPWSYSSDLTGTAQGERLYPTGRGHGFDLHYPDDIVCNGLIRSRIFGAQCSDKLDGDRFGIWEGGYLRPTANLLDTSARSSYEWKDNAGVSKCPPTGDAANDPAARLRCAVQEAAQKNWGDGGADTADRNASDILEQALIASLKIDGFPKVKFDSDQPVSCAANLSDAVLMDQLGLPKAAAAPGNPTPDGKSRCAAAWTRYASSAWNNLNACAQRGFGQAPAAAAAPDMAHCGPMKPVDAKWKDLVLNPSDKPGLAAFYKELVFNQTQ